MKSFLEYLDQVWSYDEGVVIFKDNKWEIKDVPPQEEQEIRKGISKITQDPDKIDKFEKFCSNGVTHRRAQMMIQDLIKGTHGDTTITPANASKTPGASVRGENAKIASLDKAGEKRFEGQSPVVRKRA